MTSKRRYPFDILPYVALAMTMIASLLFLNGCSESFANADRVVSAEDGKLTVAKDDGLYQETHEVAIDAEVYLDGEPASIESLDNGDAVKLTMQKESDGAEVVRRVDAKSKESLIHEQRKENHDVGESNRVKAVDAETTSEHEMLEETFTGEIIRIDQQKFAMKDSSSVERELVVTDETTFTLDGNEAAFEDLQVNQQLVVIAERGDQGHVAMAVNAKSEVSPGPGQSTDELPQEDSTDESVQQSFTGTIASIGDHQFVIKDDSDVEQFFQVDEETEMTLDGKPSTVADLRVDYFVTVTATKKSNIYVADVVDATTERQTK